MEAQPYQTLKQAQEKLNKVRDAQAIGDGEQIIIIDVCATIRTLLEQYTAPAEGEHTGGWFEGIKQRLQ